MRLQAHSIQVTWAFLSKKCLSLVFLFSLAVTQLKAQAFDVFKEPCLFVTLASGSIDAYPLSSIDGNYHINGDSIHIRLTSGSVVGYHKDEYRDIGTEIPQLPHMTSYKFNNKYNPNLNQDVEATSIDDVIDFKINAIGKSLTASFQLSDNRAVAYIGDKLQTSKVSRNRFDRSIEYTVTYPGYNVVTGGERMPFGRIYTINTEWLTDNGKVARIDIDIEKGHSVTSKKYYMKARFSITGHGTYYDFSDSVQIKGRGNNSWNYSKKSYRLKFDQKVKPFGLTKGKSWVLLANPQHGSLMTNAIAMKIGQLANVPYTNHIIPVELYINGKYQGSYIFTENIGLSNNSVDVDEEGAYMLELDSYYDEEFRFRSASSNLPVNIKDPDLMEDEINKVSSSLLESMLNDNCHNSIPSQNLPGTSLIGTVISNYKAQDVIFNAIKEQFNRLDSIVCNNGNLDEVLDLDAAARFVLVNEFVFNREILHPKSTFLWKSDILSSDSKFILGPIWDFDYAFGYVDKKYFMNVTRSRFTLNIELPGSKFFTSLRQNREFQRHYYKVWREFIEKECIKEVMEYIADYYAFVKESYANNAGEWGDDTAYGDGIPAMQQWVKKRYDYIVANLTVYDITDLVDDSEAGDGGKAMDTPSHNHTDMIYTIYGERVTDSRNLQQGLYIINGKKVFIRRK